MKVLFELNICQKDQLYQTSFSSTHYAIAAALLHSCIVLYCVVLKTTSSQKQASGMFDKGAN